MQRLIYPVLLTLLVIFISTPTYAQHDAIMQQVNSVKKMAAEEGYIIEDEGGGMVNSEYQLTFDTEYFGADYQYVVYAFSYFGTIMLMHFEDFESGKRLPLRIEVRSGDNGVNGATFTLDDSRNNFGRFHVSSGTSERYYLYGLLCSKKK